MLQKLDSLFLSILCVGTDPHFMSYLYAATEFLNPSIDLARNIEEAKRKLSFQFYDIYFIDLHGNESETLDLLEQIKIKSNQTHYVTLIANSFEQEKKFGFLKENNTVNAFLTKPIAPQAFDQIVQEISKKFTKQDEEETVLDSRLEKLKKSYDQSIPEKISILNSLIVRIKESPTSKNLQDFKDAVHKIAGTAGSFGYDEVTRLCKEMQNEVMEQLKLESHFDSGWIAKLDLFLTKIKENFLKNGKVHEKTHAVKDDSKTPLVLVVDPDKKFLLSLEQIADSFQIELKTLSEPSQAVDLLSKGALSPDALFCSLEFPGSYYTGYTIFNAISQALQSRVIIKGLIINEDNLDVRIDAVQRGINLVFKRPILAQAFLHMIEDAVLLEKMRKFKVLILDDDTDFCNFATVVLSGVGIEVKAINSSDELFFELNSFKPNLLLLDLVLPKYDGFNLLKTIRQDSTYKHLPIIIVTGNNQSSTMLDAYAAKADDVLFKPITIDLLQKRVISFLGRQEQYRSNEVSEISSIELCHKNLVKKLYQLMHHQVEGCYLVLFETVPPPQGLKESNIRRDDEMVFFNDLIAKELDIQGEFFGYELNNSAIVFERSNLEKVKSKTLDFFQEWFDQYGAANFKIRAILMPINEELGGHPEGLITSGESELKKINIPPSESLFLETLKSNTPSVRKKEIVIIDPDEGLTNILKIAFEERGFHVRVFKMGKEGLDFLLDPATTLTPSLVITERKLVDMDGIQILKQVKKNLKDPPPIFILTLFSSDKDISEGLQLGASEYIVKPFNTSLLLQKALMAIQERSSS